MNVKIIMINKSTLGYFKKRILKQTTIKWMTQLQAGNRNSSFYTTNDDRAHLKWFPFLTYNWRPLLYPCIIWMKTIIQGMRRGRMKNIILVSFRFTSIHLEILRDGRLCLIQLRNGVALDWSSKCAQRIERISGPRERIWCQTCRRRKNARSVVCEGIPSAPLIEAENLSNVEFEDLTNMEPTESNAIYQLSQMESTHCGGWSQKHFYI